MLSKDYIVRCALSAGFTLCGVARARVLDEHFSRFQAGLSTNVLPYLARGFERRLDPSSVLPGARSVVVCALAYPFHAPDGSGVASYARLPEDYHVRIRRMLRVVADLLRSPQSPRLVATKICCDTSPILEKAWAVEAGLGWQGRNSLIINPLHGSFLLLGEILLDAEVDRYDEPFAGSGCGSCRACVDACPVGALDGGTVDTSRCISSLTNEIPRLTGTAPQPIHGWIRGCDECQIACPQNKKFGG